MLRFEDMHMSLDTVPYTHEMGRGTNLSCNDNVTCRMRISCSNLLVIGMHVLGSVVRVGHSAA